MDPEEELTVKVKVVVLLKGEPVTVIIYDPTGVEGEVEMVKVEGVLGEEGLLVNDPVAPDGSPKADRVTPAVVPEIKVLVMVLVPGEP